MTALQEIPGQRGADVSITGASGYLGRSLITDFARVGIRFTALMHSTREPGDAQGKYFCGDLLQRESLSGWLESNHTVVHLAYIWSAGEAANIQATKNLIAACRDSGVKRVVHVSTAAVVGRSDTSWVDERTPCSPVTEYGRTKLEIEQVMLDALSHCDIDVVMLRPTSVFGPGGAPLEKLCRDLCQPGWVKNYLRACLFGRRAMNLVHIDNVVAAIRFAIDYPGRFSGEALIVSDDGAPENNFQDVESIIRKTFQLGNYPVPLVPLPRIVLETFLRAMRRNIVDTRCRFSSARIRELGFVSPMAFERGLTSYAECSRGSTESRVRSVGNKPGIGQGGSG